MAAPQLQAALDKANGAADSVDLPEGFELWIGQGAIRSPHICIPKLTNYEGVRDAEMVYIDHERRRALHDLPIEEPETPEHLKTDEYRTQRELFLPISFKVIPIDLQNCALNWPIGNISPNIPVTPAYLPTSKMMPCLY